ncbi:MAG: ComEC/Rec2 family competence protein [Candidatus Nanoperiomorbaceae bacterium]
MNASPGQSPRRARKLVNPRGTNFSWDQPRFWHDLWRRRVHSSWLIAATGLGFLVGVGVANLDAAQYFVGAFWLVASIILLILALISRTRAMIVVIVLAGILLGIARGNWALGELANYQNFIGRSVEIEATVSDDPGLSASNSTTLKLDSVKIRVAADGHSQAIGGHVFASVMANKSDIKRSDVVQLSGKLKDGFGSFSASMSYARLDRITELPGSDPAREVRDFFGQKLRKVIPSPASDLGMGILAGQKTALPPALTAAFIAASLMHIVVASGYNLTILVRFARRLFAKISRLAALIFSGMLVLAFANMTGFSPSMMRASLVAILSLIAWYYGRKFHPVVLLLIVAVITVALDPTSLWGDAGWWMSFSSFAGVLIFAPLVKSYFWGDQKEFRPKSKLRNIFRRQKTLNIKSNDRQDLVEKKHSVREIFIETFSAQLMSAPIIALMMGQFSPYGLLANLLVLPIVPLAMLMTFIAGVATLVLPIGLVTTIIAWPATQLLNYIIDVTSWVADFPGANQQVSFGVLPTVIVFSVILSLILLMKCRTKHSFYDDNLLE